LEAGASRYHNKIARVGSEDAPGVGQAQDDVADAGEEREASHSEREPIEMVLA
jgi:hypothetical protein